MFKSVFGRLLITYLVITVIVVATLSIVVSSLYKDAIFSEKRSNLTAVAQKVSLLTEGFINNRILASELDAAIDAMGYSTNAIIYALKIDKTKYIENNDFTFDGMTDILSSNDLQRILNNETVFRNRQYAKDFGTYVLFLGSPLNVDDQTIGAVIILCPIDGINAAINRMNLTVWLASFGVILISMPLIYLNSRRISRPIKELEKAARKIAAGEKVYDAKIVSYDEIGKLTESFYAMKDQIEKTERVRRELIANISHDLRTPLTSINGFVQGMLDGIVKPEDQAQYLTIIQEETNRLIHLTSDILDLAKIESGSVQLKPEILNLKNVTDMIISGSQFKAHKRGISVINEIGPAIQVTADEDRLKQILSNILSNALKYSKVDGRILLTAEAIDSMVRISVQDNGIGITEADLPFIFEKFFRGDQSRQADEESTGLGLSIVKNLVHLSGGTIEADSEPGKGTIVRFSLPAAL